MKAIARRVKSIENKLYMSNGQRGVFIVGRRDDGKQSLPEPIEEWITYREAKANCGKVGIFIEDPAAELEARENLRKATEGQSNE